MRTVNIHTAKAQLSRLVEAAAAGEEIIIAKSGRPVARLGPSSAREESAVSASSPGNCACRRILMLRRRTKSSPPSKTADARAATVRQAADGVARVNITLPERLLRRIDARVKNRSAFLARAAEKALAES
jgi:prevent-host-death family protein